jgi:hypothetical protein
MQPERARCRTATRYGGKILDLRDRGLTWPEIAEQVGMTVSGAWSRHQRARRQSLHSWAVGSRSSPTPLTKTWQLACGRRSLIISAECPPGLS